MIVLVASLEEEVAMFILLEVLANGRGDLGFRPIPVEGPEPVAPVLQENISVILPVKLQRSLAKNASLQELRTGARFYTFLMKVAVEHIGFCQMFPCVPGKVGGSVNFGYLKEHKLIVFRELSQPEQKSFGIYSAVSF